MEKDLLQHYLSLVEQMLEHDARKKKFNSVKDRMIWERGYLTGFVASLAYNDSDVAQEIRKKIKK